MIQDPYVLVIDDEPHICESCERILSGAGIRVDTHMDGKKGFHQALENPYDAILLDLKLPGADGMDILDRIREKKPHVPVVIITGYPSEESRERSEYYRVHDYVTKPFGPDEILKPVQNAILTKPYVFPRDQVGLEQKDIVSSIRYFKNAWFYPHQEDLVRAGGYPADLGSRSVIAAKIMTEGNQVFKGLPLAEIRLFDGSHQFIPSPVNGKITLVNESVIRNPKIIERSNPSRGWFALIEPEDLEEDQRTTEKRCVLLMASTVNRSNPCYRQLARKAYQAEMVATLEDAMRVLAGGQIKVMIIDIRGIEKKASGYAERIGKDFPHVKLIVLSGEEEQYESTIRQKAVFYYDRQPVSDKKLMDLLHCAFNPGTSKKLLKNPYISRFFPPNMTKVSITNRHGQKVTLVACNELLQADHGLGYLLTKELKEHSYPLDVSYSKFRKHINDPEVIQEIDQEKDRNQRILVLYARDLGLIPGSMVKSVRKYPNRSGSEITMVDIAIQPIYRDGYAAEPDDIISIALKDIIMRMMISGGTS